MVPESSVVSRLVQHNLEIVFPNEEEKELLHKIILEELSNNTFTDASRQYFVQVIRRLYNDYQVEGIVLGCTGQTNPFWGS